jgi:hypothetical protein
MTPYIVAGIFALIFVTLGIRSLWDRFRYDRGVQEWMLKTPHLDGLCADYLDYIKVPFIILTRSARSFIIKS